MTKGLTRTNVSASLIALLVDVIPEPGRQTERYNALSEYIDGKPIKYIEATHHVNRSDVLEMFRAALERHADGRLWGYRVCKRWSQVRKRKKRASSKTSAGKFEHWLESLKPEHAAFMVRVFSVAKESKHLNCAKYWRDVVVPFLKDAENGPGYTKQNYPLKNRDLGAEAFRRHLKKATAPKLSVLATAAEAIGASALNPLMRFARPLDFVQIDECEIDFVRTVRVVDAKGTVLWIPTSDITILAARDACYPIVWGFIVFYHKVVSEEDMYDFLITFNQRWTPRRIKSGNAQYAVGAAMPTGRFPEFIGAQFSALMADRALAHKAYSFTHSARRAHGFSLNLGPAHRWIVRHTMEGTFSIVDTTHVHQEAATLGTGPDDPRREHAFTVAVDQHIEEAELLDLLSVAFADFNGARHGGPSGLEQLENYLKFDKNFMVRTLPPPLPNAPPLYVIVVNVRVRASATGNYVHHHGTWRGGALNSFSPETVVQLHIDRQDIRAPQLYFEGVDHGYVTAEKRWNGDRPILYSSLVAASRRYAITKADNGQDSHPDYLSALERAEQKVAKTKGSRRHSPSKDASLLADLRRQTPTDQPPEIDSERTPGTEVKEGKKSSVPSRISVPQPLPTQFQFDEELLQRIAALGSVSRERNDGQ